VPWYCLPHYIDQANKKAGVLLVTPPYLENDSHPEGVSGVLTQIIINFRQKINYFIVKKGNTKNNLT